MIIKGGTLGRLIGLLSIRDPFLMGSPPLEYPFPTNACTPNRKDVGINSKSYIALIRAKKKPLHSGKTLPCKGFAGEWVVLDSNQ